KGWLSAGISANEGARTDGRKMAKQLEVKDAALVEYLAQEMKSTQPERRQWAAQWLTEVPVNDELRKAAIKGLEELLIDNNERVREQLGKALAKWATTKDDVPTLVVA